jgi:hypothetical protein
MGQFDANEFPIYAAPYRLYAPILDFEGNLVTSGGGLSATRSINAGSFGNCTNDPVEITVVGTYALDLTAAEMTSKCTVIKMTANGVNSRPTIITLFPKRMPILRTGTQSSGTSSASMTLEVGASEKEKDFIGLWLQCTNNSPVGVQGQVRKITDYSNFVIIAHPREANVDRNWTVNTNAATTYAILVPDAANVNAWMGQETADSDIDGIPAGLDRIPVTQDGKTFAETLLLMVATLLGKKSGAIGSPVYRAIDDSQDRVSAATDAGGNRSSVTLDASSP